MRALGRPKRHLVFASLFVPCPSELALSCAVVGQTAQAHCSPPPPCLSTSGDLVPRVAARVRPTGSSAHHWCGALASCMHRPCIALTSFRLLPSSFVPPSFASVAPMPPPLLICTRVLPLLVPLPQNWNHPMAHVTSPTLAVVPPPHTGGVATSTTVCAQWRGMSVWGSARSGPPEPDNGGLHEPTPHPRCTPQSSHQCRGALATVPVLHPGPLFSSVCSLLILFLIFPFGTFLFSTPLPVPPLLLPPLLPPFSCVPCLPAWS